MQSRFCDKSEREQILAGLGDFIETESPTVRGSDGRLAK